MRVRKVSNSKSDLQCHSALLAMMPFYTTQYNYVSTMHRFRYIISYFPKFKEVT